MGFCIAIGCIGLFLIFCGIVLDDLFAFVALPVIMFALFMQLHIEETDKETQSKQVAKWETEVLEPYLESFPVEKRAIVDLKIELELSKEEKE